MSINSRLNAIFADCDAISVGGDSRIVMLSDVHRGIGLKNDNFAHNKELFCAALSYYNKERFTYIELGDGEELWENRDLCRIVDHYADVYELFRRFYMGGRLIMVYGNHDIVKRSEKITDDCYRRFCSNIAGNRYPLFPELSMKEGLRLRDARTNREVFLIHGHQVDYINSRLWKLSRLLVRRVWAPLEKFGVKDPTSASGRPSKSGKIAEKMSKWSKEHDIPVICGHNHRFYFPSPGETPYFNTGCCIYRDYITGLEIVGGTIRLVKWKMKKDRRGREHAACDIIGGPRRLSDCFYGDGR